MPNHLLKVSELAQYLHVGKLTVYRMIEDGELPAIRVRGQIRIDPRAAAKALGLEDFSTSLAPTG